MVFYKDIAAHWEMTYLNMPVYPTLTCSPYACVSEAVMFCGVMRDVNREE